MAAEDIVFAGQSFVFQWSSNGKAVVWKIIYLLADITSILIISKIARNMLF